jgi:hypothetical protein
MLLRILDGVGRRRVRGELRLLPGGRRPRALVGSLNGPAGALLLGASLVASVVAFRAVHDWVVLRWSNEAKPFLYGAWRFRRFV